jgi:propanol-preferring alcohol dehydrogenase
MRAMVLTGPSQPLRLVDLPIPAPGPSHVLVKVTACAVCRTDLHIVDGELANPCLPLIPGHEIVGRVAGLGEGVTGFQMGDRVGIPWLAWACGECRYCRSTQENLCDAARFTGYTVDGGYTEYTVAYARFCLRVPETYGDAAAAPLMCAGLIGSRALRKAGPAPNLGIYGFGAAGQIVAQVARFQSRRVFAFVRPGDLAAREFALSEGAAWAGDSDQTAPDPLDAALIFAPVGSLIPAALAAVRKGGTVVCGGIHMSDLPSFPYRLLWEERVLCSVANLTRQDGAEFMATARQTQIRSRIHTFPLAQANEALANLRAGQIQGAAVLLMD